MIASRSLHPRLKKFLINPNAKIWETDFPLDPTHSPFGEDLVSDALCIDRNKISWFLTSGVLLRTCRIKEHDGRNIYFSSYWDILQASICLSLMEIKVSVCSAIDIAADVCDQFACEYEEAIIVKPISVDDLISVIRRGLQSASVGYSLQMIKFSQESIAAKVAIDLLNTHERLCSQSSCGRSVI